MPILNQNLKFKDLPADVRRAFHGEPENDLLVANKTLFRFSSHSGISPWWSDARELSGLLLAAKASGRALSRYVRERTAVLRQWDPDMTYLIVARLNKPVYAFRGIISHQDEAAVYMDPEDLKNYKKKFTKSVFFRGGNGQVYINGLQQHDVDIIVPMGTVYIYDKIDDILDFLISQKVI